MITRRRFLGLLGATMAHQASNKIYLLPPLGGWAISSGVWTYRYTYRNVVTGCVSDAKPQIEQLGHTFAFPELDVIDYSRHLADGSFEYIETIMHEVVMKRYENHWERKNEFRYDTDFEA